MYSPNSQSRKTVAGYVLQQKLGSGSFATVYKGTRVEGQESSPQGTHVGSPKRNDHVVAIKVITRTSEKLTQKVLQNLEMEIKILQTYQHPNIVCLHHVQKTEQHFYLFLEYCGGGDVQKLIRGRKDGRLSERLSRRLMRDLAAGLKFLWGQELIHRDIKPQNLLLTGPLPLDETEDPEKMPEIEEYRRKANFPSDQFMLKIADFGFARPLQTASLAETLCGSPLYMAPEILQHHRYDAKADLWSVGTVLFEMITGKPPFTGENHIDLLRNIKLKAVRIPPGVKVSKECIDLLRMLLNRNPLSRAGFQEFFAACDAFVHLGCGGSPAQEKGTIGRPMMNLGTIPEGDGPVLGSEVISNQTGMGVPKSSPSTDVAPQAITALTQPGIALSRPGYERRFTPLVPSPSLSSVASPQQIPSLNLLSLDSKGVKSTENSSSGQIRRNDGTYSGSDDNSFVMVEHGHHKSPQTSGMVSHELVRQDSRSRVEQTTNPTSTSFFAGKLSSLTPTKSDYSLFRATKGILSTSPGTGGTLMGMFSNRNRTIHDDSTKSQHFGSLLNENIKILATAEDVGRRALAVAYLGDNRALAALKMANELSSSSILLSTPMEGVEEEDDTPERAVIEDDPGSEVHLRRRRSSSATDKSMSEPKPSEEMDEMPFAIHDPNLAPLVAAIPTREHASFHKTSSSITSPRPAPVPTKAAVRQHYHEALSCYLKALKMLKGAIGACNRVSAVLSNAHNHPIKDELKMTVDATGKRHTKTSDWLASQFKGVMERAEATNCEIGKMTPQNAMNESLVSNIQELIYNHALSYGREGAVKHLLGQYEAARASYRSAGLLAETLMMESNIDSSDKTVLETYVDGFSQRITELDSLILSQSRSSRTRSSFTLGGFAVSSGQPIVGLVQPPKESPSFNRTTTHHAPSL